MAMHSWRALDSQSAPGEPAVPLPEAGSRRIWPTPVPAHAIHAPQTRSESGRWRNDLHVPRPDAGPGKS